VLLKARNATRNGTTPAIRGFFMGITEQQYNDNKLRLIKADEIILQTGVFCDAPRSWLDEYNKIANQQLEYEIEHDLLKVPAS
jgi:hypothetical protein